MREVRRFVAPVKTQQYANISALTVLLAKSLRALVIVPFSREREKVREARMRAARRLESARRDETAPHPAFGHLLPLAGEGAHRPALRDEDLQ
jgi:hypothetical protein